MFLIPGWLISIVTFPGVIFHEIAHRFFADMAKVEVYEARYFRLGNPAGYVIHGPVEGLKQSFLISVGPLVVNSIICVLLTFTAIFPIFILKAQDFSAVFIILLWLGYSIGMHAFPSNEDMANIVQAVKNAEQGGLLLLAAKLFAWFFKIVNALRIIWFDAIYAVGISLILPFLFGFL